MSSVPFIEMKDVAFAYGDRPILNNINFSIPQGNFAAVMGGSGSGKTTLMRLITGQIHPQSGKVLIEGRDLAGFSADELYEHRRRMGVLFQHGALFTDLSVYDNIAFPMRELTKLPEVVIRDLVLLKLNAVGLRGVEKLMPAELSGGMARRVALARTIALDPELMLYDEPFTGLDPISLGVIAHLISRANKALRSTSVMVTPSADFLMDRGSFTPMEMAVAARFSVSCSDSPAEFSCILMSFAMAAGAATAAARASRTAIFLFMVMFPKMRLRCPGRCRVK